MGCVYVWDGKDPPLSASYRTGVALPASAQHAEGPMIKITRKVEFDSGHRIPDHKSKCRNIHGHRYTLECSIMGPVRQVSGASDNGMVMDFGELKEIMQTAVGEPWDHAFLLYTGDYEMLDALSRLPNNHKTVRLHTVPTVENLVVKATEAVAAAITDPNITLLQSRLYETPNCWADYALVQSAPGVWRNQ